MERKPTRRQKQADAAKNKLRKSALDLFGMKGFENVTVEMVCQRAGVSKGLFYNYFSSKEEVLLEQFVELDEKYRATAQSFTPAHSARQRVLLLIQTALEEMYNSQIGHQSAQITFGAAIKQGESSLQDRNRYLFESLREIIAFGRAQGQVPPEAEDEEIIRLVCLCIWGSVFTAFLEKDKNKHIKECLLAADAILQGVLQDP